MRRTMVGLLAAAAAAMFSFQVSAADTPENRGGPPGSPMMFQRIDKNKDGKITADEIPDGAPDFVKEMLKRADKDGDKTVTAEEFRGSLPPFHGAAPDRPEARSAGRTPGPPRAGKVGALTDRRLGERVVPRPVGRDLAGLRRDVPRPLVLARGRPSRVPIPRRCSNGSTRTATRN